MRTLSFIAIVTLWLAAGPSARVHAQGGQAPPPTARAAAPIDLTGQWVSVITEDWRWRMVTPAKGDYQSVPITAEAKRAADAWDPARDTAAGEQCRSYGAAGLMRLPTRVRISWLDDHTLTVETDAGMQTRLFYFAPKTPPQGRPTWQGDSVATWEITGPAGPPPSGGGPLGIDPAPGQRRSGSLKVVTTRMRPGYLRKNGIPYSADAVLTEYWDVYTRPNGDRWLVVTTAVEDPRYLQQTYLTSPNFKQEADGSRWDPTPCSATW
ncbi:MAG: hypothetical protein HY657_17640 [Acidobacteria bacterium]|nr:hypothetical protein [Acidobacteriota bacterium]